MGAGIGALAGVAGTAAAATNPIGWGMIAAQAIPEILKLKTSIDQKKMADKYAKTPRPAYEIPQAYKDYLQQTKFNAMVGGAPGSRQAREKIDRNIANQMNNAKQVGGSSAGLLGTVSALGQTGSEAIANQQANEQQYNYKNLQNYYNAEQLMGKQQIAKSEYDQRKPYDEAMAATSALHQASSENTMSAITGLMGAAQTAGKAGLFGTGGRGAAPGTGGTTPGATPAPGATAATPTPPVSNAMNFGATSDFNQYFGSPNNATEYSYNTANDWIYGNTPNFPKVGFADPNSDRYTYETTGEQLMSGQMYNATDANTGKTVPVIGNSKAGMAIFKEALPIGKYENVTPIREYNEQTSPYDYSQLPIGVMPQQSAGGDMNDYAPGARRAARRAGGEVSEFNVNLPGDITNNWANNHFGMEMPTAYGYGNTFNQIMNKIGTQYGLGDMYGEDLSNNINRDYSRFNPFA